MRAIYTMLDEEIEEAYNYWNDRSFTAELEKRSADFKSGKVKGVRWEDAKSRILSSSKTLKRK